MTVIVITPPVPVVTFEEVEKHLVEVPAEDKSYVEALTAAATAWIDGPAGWLGRAIGVQLLEWRLSAWPCEPDWRLPYPPEIEIDSISYVDPYGVKREWPFPTPLYWDNLPAVRGRPGDIRIRYWAGYGHRDPNDAGKWVNEAPAPIKVAIMMLVAQWYGTRAATVVGATPAEMPFAVNALLQPFRVYR